MFFIGSRHISGHSKKTGKDFDFYVVFGADAGDPLDSDVVGYRDVHMYNLDPSSYDDLHIEDRIIGGEDCKVYFDERQRIAKIEY